MRLRHLGRQDDAAVVEGDALLEAAQLIVDGADQQQQTSLVVVLRVYLGANGILFLYMLPRLPTYDCEEVQRTYLLRASRSESEDSRQS